MKKQDLFRNIPKVDDLLNNEKIMNRIGDEPREIIKYFIDEELSLLRRTIGGLDSSEIESFTISESKIIDSILRNTKEYAEMNLKTVINGTGIVIHTNLGRSCISESVANVVFDSATKYSNLEFNLETGKRGHRYNHIEELICRLTGAEGAMVVNNNAAAVMLVLDTLAKNKEAIVSRGELVEIGGSFRVPDVMKRSGTTLREVGTTNKTHLRDYENAITEETGVLLKVHTSNYRILGFTKSVEREDLVTLGKNRNIPVYEDLGSGLLFDFSDKINIDEPTVQEIVKKGVDVISFSGDKMLGGPQSGIIVGKRKYIEEMKYNQLTRALRVDKMTLAALEGTLRQYLDIDVLIKNNPTIKNILLEGEEILKKAEDLRGILDEIKDLSTEIIKDTSQVGGGSMPLTQLETYGVVISIKGYKPDELSKNLRLSSNPVVGRIKNDQFIIDLRTVENKEFYKIKESLIEIISGGNNV
ncbi:MAG TPA: L-seryl-tRNA(Sec) selenium transferase [Clostridia bacterium]|nr:L-seryl-tRNA(Sec) selenium transferase [Clostridia bacterium]